MSIVLICPWFFPNLQRGGTPIAAYNFGKALAETGREVIALTTSNYEKGKFAKNPDFQEGNLHVRYVDPVFKSVPRSELFSMRLLLSMTLLASKDRIFYLHTSRNLYSIASYVLKKFGLIKGYVICPHGSYSAEWIHNIGHPRLKQWYQRLIEKPIIENAIAVHYLDPNEQRITSKLVPNSRSIVVPNAIKFQCTSDVKKRNKDSLRCVFIGRIHPQKNLINIVNAFNKCDKLVELDIYGPVDDSAYFSSLELLLNKRIRYLGYLPNENVRQTLSNYDVFVLCSKVEGVSIALLEAAESGMGIMYSNGLANAQVLEDFNVGFCVGEGSTVNIMRGLDLFFENMSSLDKFSENSRAMCREIYSEKAVSDKLGYEFDTFFVDG